MTHSAATWSGWMAAAGLAVALTSGCSRFCDEPCAEEGLCSIRTYRAGDALYRCYAGSDDDCSDSRACREEGRCFATEQGECVLAEEVAGQACAISDQCTRWGQCGHRDGVCWAESDADCEASFECRTIGRCGARGGVCIPLSEAHCEQSLGCEIEGLCERFSYLRLGYECRVPLDDATACAQSWVCEHYGRCAPAIPANCEGCRYGFCAEPGEPGRLACSPAAAVTPSCSTDGRCAPDATYACAHAPIGGPGPGPVSGLPTTKPDGQPSAAPPAPSGANGGGGGGTPAAPGVPPSGPANPGKPPTEATKPPQVPPLPPPSIGAPGPPPLAPPSTPAPPTGPGAVAFDLDAIDGRPYEGVLTYASVLTGVSGFQDQPIDFLVLRATPEEGCSPRSSSAFLPLGAFWLMGALPDGEGTFPFEGGPMPGQMSAKTWLWTGDTNSGSRNLALHGSITVTSRTATEVRGTVDFRVTEYFNTSTLGTLSGTFVAPVVDCSDYSGGWPM